MKVLRSRLYEMEMRKQQDAIAKDRRSRSAPAIAPRRSAPTTSARTASPITASASRSTSCTEALDGDIGELIDAARRALHSRRSSRTRPTRRRDDAPTPYRRRRCTNACARSRSVRQRRHPPAEAAIDADVLARHVLGWDRARAAHARPRAAAAGVRRRASTRSSRRRAAPRAGRLHHRRPRVLGPRLRGHARRPDPAAGDGAHRRGGARAGRCARRRLPPHHRRRHRQRLPRDRARARAS